MQNAVWTGSRESCEWLQYCCLTGVNARQFLFTQFLYSSECWQPQNNRGADKSLARPGKKQATATEDWVLYILFIIIIGGILVLFIYITRLASNEIVSPSNKIHWEVGQAKDLSAPLYAWMLGSHLHSFTEES